MFIDCQLVAVVACVAWAAAVVVRRAMRLFSEPPSQGCGSGGCSSCPSNQSGDASGRADDGFVPLQTLVEANRPVTRDPKT